MSQSKKIWRVLGMMSGTSLDGLDLCLAQFELQDKQWIFNIVDAETIEYPQKWKNLLKNAETMNAESISSLDHQYGVYLGIEASKYLNSAQQEVDLIASHGHTIFHQPQNGFTLQIGHGGNLASISGFKVVSDFRSQDLALGGQGAPLVPIGDKVLFSQFNACINIGGITNVTVLNQEYVIAYDIAPSNMILNYLTQKYFDKEYDKNGAIASKGKLNKPLFEKLNQWEYYYKNHPKSLGKEDIFNEFINLIEDYDCSTEDKMHTFCEHWAFQTYTSLKKHHITENILLSGGGAKNQFLIDCLAKYVKFDIAKSPLIDAKEALIFGLLGLLRNLEKPNVLASVTGAKKDHSSGAIYLP